MKQTSELLVNTGEYVVEHGTSLKKILRRKPHRKTVSGLRLLTESSPKTARPSSDDVETTSEAHVEEECTRRQQRELPCDVLMHQIFARLPIKSLLRSMSVSKEWYRTLCSNDFANVHFKTHLNNFLPSSPVECLFIKAANSYYLLYIHEEEIILNYSLVKLEPNFDDFINQNDVSLVGSCNGLVCLSDSLKGCFYVWNPIVYDCQKYFEPSFSSYNYVSSWGFAYVPSMDDYKVVRIAENYDTQEIMVRVFSLKTKEWKDIRGHGLDRRVSLTKTNPGVLVNETLFWIMETKDLAKERVIMGFDLSLEKFGYIPDLIPRGGTTFRNHFLCVVGGCLSLCSSNMRKESCLSIMKQPGMVESSSLFSSSDSLGCSGLVGFTKTGKSVVVSKSWELALVDQNSSPRRYLPLVTFKDAEKPCIVSYFASLISPSLV